MIGILKCLDNRVTVVQCVGQKTFQLGESFSRPMLSHDPADAESFRGIDLSLYYARQFKWCDSSLELKYSLYDEVIDWEAPPEILTRRAQELESEFTRLGKLIEEFRKRGIL